MRDDRVDAGLNATMDTKFILFGFVCDFRAWTNDARHQNYY